MSEFVLFLMIVALGLALRRAFVRIDYLEREVRRAQPPRPKWSVRPNRSFRLTSETTGWKRSRA